MGKGKVGREECPHWGLNREAWPQKAKYGKKCAFKSPRVGGDSKALTNTVDLDFGEDRPR